MSIANVLAEGRLIRRKWSDKDPDGRQLLCLYTSLMDDPLARPSKCPASVAPQWIAELLPWMDDVGTDDAWPAMVRRVADLAPKLGSLTGERSERLRSRCLARVLREFVLPMAGTSSVVVVGSLNLLDLHAGGGDVTHAEWAEASATARAEASATAWAEASTVIAAEAWATERVVVWAAAWATERSVVWAATADRITSLILDEIEKELSK